MVMKREYKHETGKRELIDSHEAWFHGFGEESNGEGCHDIYAIVERCDNGIVEMHDAAIDPVFDAGHWHPPAIDRPEQSRPFHARET